MAGKLKIFVATKGHPFNRDALEAMLLACEVEPTFVDQPAASAMLNPDAMAPYDCILLYDMWGLDFEAPRDQRPAFVDPDESLVRGIGGLLEQGKGIVGLHHAIASWPTWQSYAHMLGGRFFYKDATLAGRVRQDSGYCQNVTYDAVTCPHPVTHGVAPAFRIAEELYAMEILEEEEQMVPLLLRETPVEADRFLSARHAVQQIEERGDWMPPEPSRLLGWAKRAGNSPLVYLQPGDGPEAFGHPEYRKLLGNALRWVASDEARDWRWLHAR